MFLQYGNVWTCSGLLNIHDEMCTFTDMNACQLSVFAADTKFSNVRTIGDRYLIATNAKEMHLIRNNGNVATVDITNDVFELMLTNETAIIGSQHLSPISSTTHISIEFMDVSFMRFAGCPKRKKQATFFDNHKSSVSGQGIYQKDGNFLEIMRVKFGGIWCHSRSAVPVM